MDFEAGKVVVDILGSEYPESACIQTSGGRNRAEEFERRPGTLPIL